MHGLYWKQRAVAGYLSGLEDTVVWRARNEGADKMSKESQPGCGLSTSREFAIALAQCRSCSAACVPKIRPACALKYPSLEAQRSSYSVRKRSHMRKETSRRTYRRYISHLDMS